MRKILTWAAVVLLLVVSLHDPVVSRSTPYPADEWVPQPDHPWGGDQSRDGQESERVAAATGLPVLDITYTIIYRWYFGPTSLNSRQVFVIPNRPNIVGNNQPKPKPQTGGTTSNPNPAD